ncbi:apidaecins type 73-like [Cervus elaphus]|uniref:apidaecins type 73-like n=1 Tax=Cervus elaphus TaxID=9860 RepID=UPI001CC29942|nr:apidaecins type 73-like [Cervus elaphus]
MEGSAQGGVKSKRGRPPQKPPRTHRGAQSQAASRLSTPGSDPEPRAPLPLRQHEDLEPSAAEHREVLAARAGPRDPLRGHRDLIHPASKTLDQLVPGHHTGQIGPLCRQDAQPQSFPPDVADEGDTPSTSSREGSEPHPPAREAQCRVQSQAASRLSTPGSDPEPRAPLPLRQHEDLEPSAAEHRGGAAGPHRERALSTPGLSSALILRLAALP